MAPMLTAVLRAQNRPVGLHQTATNLWMVSSRGLDLAASAPYAPACRVQSLQCLSLTTDISISYCQQQASAPSRALSIAVELQWVERPMGR